MTTNQQFHDDVRTLRDSLPQPSERRYHFMVKRDHIRVCVDDGTAFIANEPFGELAALGYQFMGANLNPALGAAFFVFELPTDD